MLDQRVNWNRKESGEKSENGEQAGDGVVGQSVTEKQRGDNRHADHAERDQSVFDFVSGEISGGDAADGYAH